MLPCWSTTLTAIEMRGISCIRIEGNRTHANIAGKRTVSRSQEIQRSDDQDAAGVGMPSPDTTRCEDYRLEECDSIDIKILVRQPSNPWR